MDQIYKGTNGTDYMVSETPLASGGEGYIYEIRGYKELVLKVFKPERRTKEREEKLLKMIQYKLDKEQLQQITWPQDVVYDEDEFVGYVMPRLWDNQNLNKVYATGNDNLTLRHRMLIAYNLCAAINTVHSLNQVCGDLNPQNICVNLNLQSKDALRITLVDTDSYHITDDNKTYRCEVGLGNYLAPEIQNKLSNGLDLKSASLPTFTKETDLFALAVHIFSLVMNGCHPFACAKKTNQGYEHNMEQMNDVTCDSVVLPQPVDNIKDGFFPFHQKKEGITYPLYAPEFESLPVELQTMFIRAFEDGYKKPKARPNTEDWLDVLKSLLDSSYYNQCMKRHYYFTISGTGCPYCAAEERMRRVLMDNVPTYTSPTSDIGGVVAPPSGGSVPGKTPSKKKQKRGPAKVLVACLILVLGCTAMMLAFEYVRIDNREQVKKEYTNYVADAEAAKQEDDNSKAIQKYENAVKTGVAEKKTYIDLADCYIKENKLDEAVDTLSSCEEEYSNTDELAASYEEIENQYYAQAQGYVKDKKYQEATTLLNNAMNVLPSAEKLKDYQSAVTSLELFSEYIEEQDYYSAHEEYVDNLATREESEFSEAYSEVLPEAIDYIEQMAEQIDDKKPKGAHEIMIQYDEKYEGLEIWYADGKVQPSGDDITGKCFHITGQGYLYYGEVVSGLQDGEGTEIGELESGYYYVAGNFANDLANGKCAYFISESKDSKNNKYNLTIRGNFTDGYEDGEMKENRQYLVSKEKYEFRYTADMGEYEVIRNGDDGYFYYGKDEKGNYLGYDNEEALKGNGVPRKG